MKNSKIKVPFSRPSIDRQEEKAVLKVVRSGWLTTGNETFKFESEFSDFMNKGSAQGEKKVISLAVNSNTSGMILALNACGVKEGTAVITTPYTFVSTAACAKHLGDGIITPFLFQLGSPMLFHSVMAAELKVIHAINIKTVAFKLSVGIDADNVSILFRKLYDLCKKCLRVI